jgi:phenylacetyl-CoA:acceptor oxidoreductase subunit 2
MSYGPRPWQQLHWDERAAANFILGGTGAGLLIAWAVSAAVTPVWQAYLLAGMASIGLGLGAVWLEIGRKLRAIHVFFHPQTSWMTREAMVAAVLFGFGLAAVVLGLRTLGFVAALFALGFVYCQGRILHASKGIPAWREPTVTAFIVTTGLAEGAGAFLAASAVAGSAHRAGLAFFALAAVARVLAWSRYRARLEHGASRRALDALDPAGRMLVQLGTIVPLVLAVAGLAFSEFAAPAGIFAGLLALGTGWYLKFVLVTRASFNQGFALPKLPVRGSR